LILLLPTPATADAAQQLASQTYPDRADRPSVRSDGLARELDNALSLYRRSLDSSGVAGLLEQWNEEGGPRTDLDYLIVAALWRRAGVTGRALAALERVDSAGDNVALADLERARVQFSYGLRDGRGDTDSPAAALSDVWGSQSFWAACRAMNPRVKAELWSDFRGLALPAEAEEWNRLPADGEACAWVRGFLARRALGMAISIDERLAMHYRRLEHAREWYYLRKPRFTRDLTDRMGRPDSLEFDDRGLVFLRMGPPDRQAGELNVSVQSNVSWAYYDPGGPRIYHFAPVSRIFAASFQPLGDYRLLENLAYASGRTMTQELLDAGGQAFARLYASRAGLDMGFARLAFDYAMMGNELGGYRSPADLLRVLAMEREQTRADAEAVMQRVPDVPQVVPVVSYAQELLRFWDPGSSAVQVWALISARAGDLTRATVVTEGKGHAEYGVDAAFGAVANGVYYLERAESRAATAGAPAPNDGIPIRLALELPPGRHPFTVLIRDQLEPQAGNWKRGTIAIPELPQGIPALSDLAVAPDSGGSWTRDGRTFLRVSPTHVTGADGSVFIYFEVYNVEPGRRYEVETRVVPASVKEPLFSGAVKDVAFTLRYRSEMPSSRIGRELLRIDLADTEPGEYLLGVRVRALDSDIVSLPAVTPLNR
jgi:hypothetical protein